MLGFRSTTTPETQSPKFIEVSVLPKPFLPESFRCTVANGYIQNSLTTDVCFLAHPQMIALVALRLAAQSVGKIDAVDRMLKEKLSPDAMAKLAVCVWLACVAV